jgi:hypothetical protein
MRLLRLLGLFLTLNLLTACASPAATAVTEPSALFCGDGVCSASENSVNCPQDCPFTPVSGKTLITYVKSEGIGKIAVQVAYPSVGRYAEGAGVVVLVSPFFTEVNSFITEPDLTSIGLIQVSYLWPGKTDARSGVRSEGEYDYGGPASIQALRDVLRFASGRQTDVNGRSLGGLVPVRPLTDELGLYAFSHAGIAALNVIALYGDDFPSLQYYIGHENPTVDTLSCLEVGHYDENGFPVANPLYAYPISYSPHAIMVDYSALRWDIGYTDERSGFVGRPYLDLNGDGLVSTGDHVFGWQVPQMFGKRYYSVALTQALLDNGALTLETWPADLATPQEAAEAWSFRQINGQFMQIAKLKNANFKVMLVFGRSDHAQVAADKPHIHQLFQGFRFEAQPSGTQLRWVRLNPDRAYFQQFFPQAGADFPDNPANTEPVDWAKVSTWGYPSGNTTLAALAAVAEMADRAHAGWWDENIGAVLYLYTPEK